MNKFSVVLMMALFSHTAVSRAVQWEFPAQNLQKIQVRGMAASVQVQRTDNPFVRMSIMGTREKEWQQEIQNGVLIVSGPESAGLVQESRLVLEIPPTVMATDLAFEDIRADIAGVGRLNVTALRGKINGRATGEGVRYFLQKGEIQSQQHQGLLEIESYGGKVSVSDGQQTLKLRVFAGEVLVQRHLAPLYLESHASNAKIMGQQGLLSLQWGRGSFNLSDFSGRLEGSSLDGQLQVQMKAESMVDLQAERGKINVTLPSDSGAQVNVRTANGVLSVPGPLKPAREGRFKLARGKLAGTIKGSVMIRSEEASITIK